MKKGLLVLTRPREDSRALAARLTREGFDCLIEPMLRIEELDARDELAYALTQRPQAVLATSRHAISALAHQGDSRDLPLIAVGGASAAAAREAGFEAQNAGGSARILRRYIRERLAPRKGPLLYARGETISFDLAKALRDDGFTVAEIILYKAISADCFSADLRRALSENKVSGVLFFSARSAETYVRLATGNSAARHAHITAYCLSEKVADATRALRWEDFRIASRSTAGALISLLKSS